MWFQQHGCPAHYSRSVRQFLDEEYSGRWIEGSLALSRGHQRKSLPKTGRKHKSTPRENYRIQRQSIFLTTDELGEWCHKLYKEMSCLYSGWRTAM
uniref:SFRICE_039656 n=1 Tax=Spodoptera frugiperda TaxID=7108 RepID=A0A2H1WW76_SPOFR